MDAQPPKLPDSAEELRVKLLFRVPDGMSGRYAHEMTVQPLEHEIILSFFEIISPLMIGTPEEQKETVSQGVRADCVARVIIARPRYPSFVKAMADILELISKDSTEPK